MKAGFIVMMVVVACMMSCRPQTQPVTDDSREKIAQLQLQIDSLKIVMDMTREKYKPSLGRIMMAIQQHHAKLWSASVNRKWKLSEFEAGELKEEFEDVADFHPVFSKDGKPIRESIDPEVYVILDNIQKNISAKDKDGFIDNFNILTNACTTCHKSHDLEIEDLIRITVPAYNREEDYY